jgi:HPr kinase/phosphorylase
MQTSHNMHGSCASRDGQAVLLIGPSGSGKSDLVLRLLGRGFQLVADDRVFIQDGMVSAPASLFGLLEVRGLGIVRLPAVAKARLALVADLSERAERLPEPATHAELGAPLIHIDATAASAPERIALALDCALGRVTQIAGAFAA